MLYALYFSNSQPGMVNCQLVEVGQLSCIAELALTA
jgi:hypothetical protein